MMWKINNGKIEIFFFVIESCRKLTKSVKFEVNVGNETEEVVFVVSFISIYLVVMG